MSHGSICFPRFFYLKNTRMILRDSECTSRIGEKQKGNVYSVGRNAIKKGIDNYFRSQEANFKINTLLEKDNMM